MGGPQPISWSPEEQRLRFAWEGILPQDCNWKVPPWVSNLYAQLLSCFRLFATPGTVPHQAPLSMGFSRQEYWSGLPCPPPGNLPHVSCVFSITCRFFTAEPLGKPQVSSLPAPRSTRANSLKANQHISPSISIPLPSLVLFLWRTLTDSRIDSVKRKVMRGI